MVSCDAEAVEHGWDEGAKNEKVGHADASAFECDGQIKPDAGRGDGEL